MVELNVDVVLCTDVPHGGVGLVWPMPGRKWLALFDRDMSHLCNTEKKLTVVCGQKGEVINNWELQHYMEREYLI